MSLRSRCQPYLKINFILHAPSLLSTRESGTIHLCQTEYETRCSISLARLYPGAGILRSQTASCPCCCTKVTCTKMLYKTTIKNRYTGTLYRLHPSPPYSINTSSQPSKEKKLGVGGTAVMICMCERHGSN